MINKSVYIKYVYYFKLPQKICNLTNDKINYNTEAATCLS